MDVSRYIPNVVFVFYVGLMLLIFCTVNLVSPTAFELPLFYYWHYERIFQGLLISWPVFLWAFFVTLLSLVFVSRTQLKNKNIFYENYASEDSTLFRCFIDCLLIGITEEIQFRWLFLYSNIVACKITNFCLFGLTRWFYLNLEAPIVNFVFIKQLGWLLYNQGHWSIGSAAIIANAKFRDGHAYLVILGYYNSWWLGFFEFYIMINYGLPAAICSHVLYDFIIFSMYYIHGYLGRRRSYPHEYREKYYYNRITSTSPPRLKETV